MTTLHNPRLVTPQMHLRYVLLGLMLGGLILASWLWAPTRAWWDVLDANLFYALNGSLKDDPNAQFFWAAANRRIFDVVPAGMLLSIYAHYMWPRRRQCFWEDVVIGMFMLVFTFVAVDVVHNLSEARNSPSLVLEPVYRLSELVPELQPKDASERSYPGDHAMVSLSAAFCIWFFTGWRRGLVALLVACSFAIMPRLVAGAHWPTDVLAGALPSVLIATALVLGTPLYAYIIRWMHRFLGFFLSRLIPLGWG